MAAPRNDTGAYMNSDCRSRPDLGREMALACEYIALVKSRLKGKPEVYDAFMKILVESRCQHITVASAAIKLGALFRGQPDLIRGVNDFLPPGHKIPLDGTVLNSHVDQNAVTIANRR